jgi:hypothetical protein
MEENINPLTKTEGSSAFSSKKSLSSYLNFLNKEFLIHHKDDIELENSEKFLQMIYTFLSSIFISISVYFPFFIYNKYFLTEIYNTDLFLLFHSLAIIILIPIISFIYSKKNIITEINYLGHKRWFFLRSNLNYIGMLFFLLSIKFFRCVTIQILMISSISIIILIFGYCIGGNIPQNLIFGLFCFLVGNILIIYNEIKYINNNGIYYNLLGFFFIIVSFSGFSCIKIINQKYLNLDNYTLIVHMMYNNLLIFIYSIIYLPFNFITGIVFNFNFIFLSLLSGIFFTLATFFLVLVLERKNEKKLLIIPIIKEKLIIIYNLNIFYVFLLCLFLKEEKILFKDLIAEIIVYLFKVFNGDKELKDIPCFFN